MNICRRYPGAEFWTNIFTPYPGSPIMKRAFELGIEVPKTLEGWADFFPRYTVLPWLKGKRARARAEHARIHARRVPSRANRQVPRAGAQSRAVRFDQHAGALAAGSPRLRFPGGALGAQGRGRRLLTPPKPKVDAQQLSAEPVTC